MNSLDIFLTAVYSLVILAGSWVYINISNKRNHYNHFLPALTLKIIGGISFYLVYKFYFKLGDTFVYLFDSNIIANAMVEDPIVAFKILFQSSASFNPDTHYLTSQMYYFNGESELIVVKIASFISLFSLQMPMTTTLLFSALSFIGIWRCFLFFYDQYPELKTKMAIATLYIPSVVFWGSGVMKDTLIMGFIGLLLYSLNQFFKHENRTIWHVLAIVVSVYIITLTKAYVSIALLPAIFYWILFTFNQKINNPVFKVLIIPFVVLVLSGMAFLILGQIESIGSKYSIDNLLNTAEVYQDYHFAEGDFSLEGRRSSYSLGDYSPTLTGILAMAPAAINVTLFRPYLWEIRSSAMILSSLESTIFFIYTLLIFFRVGFTQTIKHIFNNNFLTMCLFFSVIFAFAVGFSSYNFGALARYKIPCMGFYTAFLFILDYETRVLKTSNRLIAPSKRNTFRQPSSLS